eukprot:TRINITY_DN21015_c0_g1_i2.p1 TRINITY_DN21015_c0_g1~~TRINITY_DN21015_c0_g1_i2.p1  ORF type:complete len:722 (+),score=110.61 TRINITY_DN21015_c0_g1_i2:25-2166(+)
MDPFDDEYEDPFEADMEALLDQEATKPAPPITSIPKPASPVSAARQLNFEEISSQESTIVPVAPQVKKPIATQKTRRVYTEMPQCDHMCITSSDGDYMYIGFESDEESPSDDQPIRGGMLSSNLTDLKQAVDDARIRKMRKQENDTISSAQTNEASGDTLWVDKYSPRHFHELLSDELINFEVLRWIKQWDEFVFNQPTKTERMEGARRTIDKRPLERVLLLAGPPGVGKTTLAHVVARHAGYHIVEVNASSDRNATSLENYIVTATGQQMILANRQARPDKFGRLRNPWGTRPTCLIIDEIDGVTHSSAISLLVQMAQAPWQPAHKEQDGPNEKKSTRKGKEAAPIIARPVICICNDLYLPVLRELKSIAKVFTVPAIPVSQMTGRLRQICASEGLEFDRMALDELCTLADGDVRSCLNTLQFLKQKNLKVTTKGVAQANVGAKDHVRALFPLWHDILHRLSDKAAYLRRLPRVQPANEGKRLPMGKMDPGFEYVLAQISKYTEHDKVIEGVFHHYLSTGYTDINLKRTADCVDWLAWSEELGHRADWGGAFGLRKYLPYCAAQAHLRCSSTRAPKLEYPRMIQNCRQMQLSAREALQGLLAGFAAPLQPYYTLKSLSQETLPLLLSILSPKSKTNAANMHVLSVKDKTDIRELARKYVVYNLNYVSRMEGTQLIWKWEHDYDLLTAFKGQSPSFAPLPSAMRQILSREIQV